MSLLATGVYGIVKVTGCLCFLIFAADSLGRRGSLLWTSAAQSIVMFIVGIYGRVQPPVEGRPVDSFLPLTLFLDAVLTRGRSPGSVSLPWLASTCGRCSSSSAGARAAGSWLGKSGEPGPRNVIDG